MADNRHDEGRITVIDAETGEPVQAEIAIAKPHARAAKKPGLLTWLGAGAGIVVVGALLLTFFMVALAIMVPLVGYAAWRNRDAIREMRRQKKMRDG